MGKQRTKALLCCLLLIVAGEEQACSTTDEGPRIPSAPYVSYMESIAHSFSRIYAVGVSAPIGRFLLMRTENEICAVRFTGFHRAYEGNEREETLYAEYYWYLMKEDGRKLLPTEMKHVHRTLDAPPLLSFLGQPIATGDTKVKCGSLALTWGYPNQLLFVDRRYVYGVDLAPTKWQDIAEVNLASPSLRWYRLVEHRELVLIPVEDLPG